jgi:hypothetical protein
MMGLSAPPDWWEFRYTRIGGCAGLETPHEDLVSRQPVAFGRPSAGALIEELGCVRALI